MRRFILTAMAVTAGLSMGAPAGAIVIGNADSNAQDYIALATKSGFSHTDVYGTASYNAAFSSVGQIYGTDSAGAFAASGVLIASDWVLTAAHVTSGASSLTFWMDGGGTNFSRPGGIKADQIITDPQWNGTLAPGYDIGLFHLTTAEACVGNGTCFTAKLAQSAPILGSAVTEVGYGKTGTGSTGATTFDGLKRAGTNRFDGYYANGSNNILLADFDSGKRGDNYLGSSTPTAMEAIIAPGDSGGGLFATNGTLIGITSFIWGLDGNANSDFGDVGGWTNVASFYNWIECTIGAAACSSTLTASNLAATGLRQARVDVPEPASLALLALGVGGLLARSRRTA